MYAPQPNHYRPNMGGGMAGQGMHMQQQQQLQCYCPTCNTLLSFPSGATFVQCPQCQTTMNTQPSAPPQMAPPPPPPAPAPQQQSQQQQPLNFLHCPNPTCHCLLSHPPSSITIQCPRCMHIIDVSHKAATITAAPDQQPASNSSGVLGGHTASAAQKQPPPEVVVRKKRKDPNAPKRASNAYMIFCKERRAQLKLDRPDLPFGQLGKRLGEMWRSMSAEEKRLYEDRATGDRDRYKGEMNSYQSTAMMKGGRGSGGGGGGGGSSGGGGKGGSAHDAGSEADSHHDGDDGEGDEDEGEGGGSDELSGHEEEEQEVKVREKHNGDTKRAKSEVKVDTDTHEVKESPSD